MALDAPTRRNAAALEWATRRDIVVVSVWNNLLGTAAPVGYLPQSLTQRCVDRLGVFPT